MVPAVGELLLDAGIRNLEDFRFFFVKEEDIEGLLAKDEDLASQPIQAARCRRAWHAVRQHGLTREKDRALQDTADLDDVLGETELRDMKLAFWNRYKIRHPADHTPADALVSRLVREMSRRVLMVYNVSTVRTLEHHITSARKRRSVGESLYTIDSEEIAEGPPRYVTDAELYLDNLHLYLLAFAIAGSSRNPQAADSPPEVLGGGGLLSARTGPSGHCYGLLVAGAFCSAPHSRAAAIAMARGEGLRRARCLGYGIQGQRPTTVNRH